jgi:hypothetical protein
VANLLAEIAEAADALTEPYQHLEPIFTVDRHRNRRMKSVHVTRLPGLLGQLAEQFHPGATDEQGTRSTPGSRPPVNLDALSAHTAITIGSTRWMWSLGLDIRNTPASNIRALVGAASTMDSDTQRALLAELRQWRHQAEVLTGWVSAPYAPHGPCPQCEAVGGLRVRLDVHTATCLRCAAWWTPDTIDELAEHIRTLTSVSA